MSAERVGYGAAAPTTTPACQAAGAHDFMDPVVVTRGSWFFRYERVVIFCRRCGVHLVVGWE